MRGAPDDETNHRDRTGTPDTDGLYTYVDLRGAPDDDPHDVDLDDEPGPAVTRRRRTTRRPAARATTRKTAARKSGRARQRTELAGGALVVMCLIGFGAYALALHVLGLPRDAALVLAGLVAGLTPLAGRAILAGRKRLASWITPSGARS